MAPATTAAGNSSISSSSGPPVVRSPALIVPPTIAWHQFGTPIPSPPPLAAFDLPLNPSAPSLTAFDLPVNPSASSSSSSQQPAGSLSPQQLAASNKQEISLAMQLQRNMSSILEYADIIYKAAAQLVAQSQGSSSQGHLSDELAVMEKWTQQIADQKEMFTQNLKKMDLAATEVNLNSAEIVLRMIIKNYRAMVDFIDTGKIAPDRAVPVMPASQVRNNMLTNQPTPTRRLFTPDLPSSTREQEPLLEAETGNLASPTLKELTPADRNVLETATANSPAKTIPVETLRSSIQVIAPSGNRNIPIGNGKPPRQYYLDTATATTVHFNSLADHAYKIFDGSSNFWKQLNSYAATLSHTTPIIATRRTGFQPRGTPAQKLIAIANNADVTYPHEANYLLDLDPRTDESQTILAMFEKAGSSLIGWRLHLNYPYRPELAQLYWDIFRPSYPELPVGLRFAKFLLGPAKQLATKLKLTDTTLNNSVMGQLIRGQILYDLIRNETPANKTQIDQIRLELIKSNRI
jgi:hypothetical protein